MEGTTDATFAASAASAGSVPRRSTTPLNKPHGKGSISGGRSITPVRPVYGDFYTAHSSITSRSKLSPWGVAQRSPIAQQKRQSKVLNKPPRPRSRTSPQHDADDISGRPRYSRQISTLDWTVRQSDHTSSLPLDIDLNDLVLSRKSSKKQSPPNRLLGSIKRAFGSRSSADRKSTRDNANSSTYEPAIPMQDLRKESREPAMLIDRIPDPIETFSDDDERFSDVDAQMNHYRTAFLSMKAMESMQSMEQAAINASHPEIATEHNADGPYNSGDCVDRVSHYHQDVESVASGSDADTDILGGVEYMDNNPPPPLGRDRSSTPREGSTVDNIVQHYTDHNQRWLDRLHSLDDRQHRQAKPTARVEPQLLERTSIPGLSISHSSDHDTGPNFSWKGRQPHQSRVEYRENLRANTRSAQAPNMPLPKQPPASEYRSPQVTPGTWPQSASYGDTGDLLNLTPRLEGSNPGDRVVTAGASFPLSPTERAFLDIDPSPVLVQTQVVDHSKDVQSARLMRMQARQDRLSQKMMSQPPGADPRSTKERDVSAALHRVSAFSISGQYFGGRAPGDGVVESSTDSSGLLNFMNRSTPAPPPRLQDRGFYHNSAIHKTWLDNHQFERVRIPIARPASVTSEYSTPSMRHEGSGQDEEEDWETVLDSGIPSRSPSNPHRVSCRKNRAGSSIANISDDGFEDPIIYAHSDFSSTDRIIQHPARMEYSHDYRLREIREGGYPVLLPSYNTPTVNGFPMNSQRSINAFQHVVDGNDGFELSALPRNHTNPFKATPPGGLDARPHEDDEEVHRFPFNPSLRMVSGDAAIMSPYEMERPRSPRRLYGRPGAPPSGRSLDGNHSTRWAVGSSIADASTERSFEVDYEQPTPPPIRTARKNVQRPLPVATAGLGGHRQEGRQPTDGRRKAHFRDVQSNFRRSKKSPAQVYPTNQMRPLSLVEALREPKPAAKVNGMPTSTSRNEFEYRSPLAPVKSKSWRQLYTKDHLSDIRKAARADGVFDLESLSQQSSRPSAEAFPRRQSAFVRLPMSPRILHGRRESAHTVKLYEKQQQRYSTIVFLLCFCFPPLLIIYGTGYMDNMVVWMTSGNVDTFTRIHKRVALCLGCFSTIALVTAIAVLVGLKA
jgi:hypothetical protein